jgi:predicted transcriptional regulator
MAKMFPAKTDSGVHERIFLLLLKHPGLTQKEIAKKLHISEATVSRYILDLLTENFISRERDGKIWRCYAKP